MCAKSANSEFPSDRHSWSMMVPFGGSYTKGDACVAPTQIYRTSPRLGCPVGARFVLSARRHRHNLGKSALSAARSAGRNSCATGRKIAPLEAFTNWATHASPLHRYARYKAGTACVGVLWAACSSSPSPLRIGHHVRKSGDSHLADIRGR